MKIKDQRGQFRICFHQLDKQRGPNWNQVRVQIALTIEQLKALLRGLTARLEETI